MNEVQEKIAYGVSRKGWYPVSYVPEQDPDDPAGWFTYTVGLTETAGWPEIICLGLDAQKSADMLRDAIAECWYLQKRPADDMELSTVLDGLPVRLKRVEGLPPPYFTMADWYAAEAGTRQIEERLQLLWPDGNGRFPDDPDCQPRVRERQTPKAGK